jgi:hypothetical protein
VLSQFSANAEPQKTNATKPAMAMRDIKVSCEKRRAYFPSSFWQKPNKNQNSSF